MSLDTSAPVGLSFPVFWKALGLPGVAPEAYFQMVITLVRLAGVLLVLFLAFFTVSFVIGPRTPRTGAIEKVVLLALIGGRVFLAVKVSTLATIGVTGRMYRSVPRQPTVSTGRPPSRTGARKWCLT